MSSSGRPGPALLIGVPLVILGGGGWFAYTSLIKPALEDREEDAREERLKASTSASGLSGKTFGTMIKVAGDPWSGYSTFRGEPHLARALGKFDIGIQYVDDENLYDQSERMKALSKGEIDIALTTLDAFLQHGAKHKSSGLYPGVVLWNIDESNGGDAIFLAKGKSSFDDVKPGEKVCFAQGTPSEHLWDFASLAFAQLGDNIEIDPGVVAKDCWDKLNKGEVQVAVLWQPYTALAEKAGYKKIFATGGQADDVIVDVLVANRDYVINHPDKLEKLAGAYFETIDGLKRDGSRHAAFITKDCGPDCAGDEALGKAVLSGIDFLGYDDNMCLWWGQCDAPIKMTERIRKTGRLLTAKNKIASSDLPDAASILNDKFLLEIKKRRVEKAKLAAEVAGRDTKIDTSKVVKNVEEKHYDYDAKTTKDDAQQEVGTLRLPNVYFGNGRFDLDPNAQSVVAGIAERLRDFPALCIKVHGHTSSVGNAAKNLILSRKRAQSIVSQLKSIDGLAFPNARFDVQGFGSKHPLLKNGTEDAQASRRTEFKLFRCNS